jgi:hypothetical protein
MYYNRLKGYGKINGGIVRDNGEARIGQYRFAIFFAISIIVINK